jgi:hypothetical protein
VRSSGSRLTSIWALGAGTRPSHFRLTHAVVHCSLAPRTLGPTRSVLVGRSWLERRRPTSRPAKSGQIAGRAGRERVEVIIRLISPYGSLALLGPSVLNVRMNHESAECKLLDVLCRLKIS